MELGKRGALLNDIAVKFEYGNHYEFETLTDQKKKFRDSNHWSAFIRMADPKDNITDYIDNVEFHLHESFGRDGKPVVVKASDALKKPKMTNQRKDEI